MVQRKPVFSVLDWAVSRIRGDQGGKGEKERGGRESFIAVFLLQTNSEPNKRLNKHNSGERSRIAVCLSLLNIIINIHPGTDMLYTYPLESHSGETLLKQFSIKFFPSLYSFVQILIIRDYQKVHKLIESLS